MNQPVETKHSWSDLDEGQREVVVLVHLKALKKKDFDTMLRVFNLGNPNIVAGPDWDYCRIHEKSVNVMRLLIEQYC